MEDNLEMLLKILKDKLYECANYNQIMSLLKERCFEILVEIRETLDDDSLEDDTCFFKIEKIVSIYENQGLDGGTRHDF
jgi:hypothetical protein